MRVYLDSITQQEVPMSQVQQSLEQFGFYQTNTGGNCQSYVRTGEHTEIYLGLQIDGAYVPTEMSDAIRISILEDGNELFTMEFPSVTEFLKYVPVCFANEARV
jgi:hypothetical protein